MPKFLLDADHAQIVDTLLSVPALLGDAAIDKTLHTVTRDSVVLALAEHCGIFPMSARD